jgi:GNAT superfamily N-acetyltransferase
MPEIRRLLPGEAGICEEILRSLPDWFGIEESIVEYVRDVETMDTYLHVVGDRPVGFITLHRHNEHSAEIHVMGVLGQYQGKGIGRALVEHAETVLGYDSTEFLQVKTLGPSRPDANYERTRGFYEKMGFLPLEENRLWGDVNPCMIYIKHLRCEYSE